MATVGALAAQLIREGRRVFPAAYLQHILNWREERHHARQGEIGLQLARYFCREDQDAVDVGAKDGRYIHVLRKCARRIYAFEPLPWRAEVLKTKFGRDIEREKVFVKAIALSASRGMRVVRAPMAEALQPDQDSSDKDWPVRTEALDHFHLNDVGFIKLDAAGGEEGVLAGASRTILGCQPRVQIDIDASDAPEAIRRVAGWFQRLEYRGYFICQRAILSLERFEASVASSPSTGNFFFLPDSEPEATLQQLARHLAQP